MSLFLASMALLFLPRLNNPLLISMIAWIIFAFTFTCSGWIILFSNPVEHIRKIAQQEDGSKTFVFLMTVTASFASMVMVAFLMTSGTTHSRLFVPVVVAGMFVSWAMVHTVFTFHYAHMFYGDRRQDGVEDGGIDFPGEKQPDYLDFAYFSFTVGCTFQVSDTQVTSGRIRRMVLLHGLLSFVLNTFVVALSINLLAGLSK